jgi:hypothetical protein
MRRVAILLAGVAATAVASPVAVLAQDGDQPHLTAPTQSGQVKLTGTPPVRALTPRRARRAVRTALARHDWTITSLTCTVPSHRRATCEVQAFDDTGWAGSGTARVKRGRITVVNYVLAALTADGSAPAG